MNDIYNNTDLPFEKVLDYIFNELSEEEVQQMENYLDMHQDYADAVDGILSLAVDQNLDRNSLKKYLIPKSAKVFIWCRGIY